MSPRALVLACFCLTVAGCTDKVQSEPVTPRSAELARDGEPERNKALVARLYEDFWNKRDPDAALVFFAPDLVNHAAIPSAQGAEGMRTIARKLFVAFPDHKMTVEDVVAEKDRVVVRVISEGTHTNTLEFATPIPPSGKHVRIEQVHVYRIAHGKIVETWMTMDKQELARQSAP